MTKIKEQVATENAQQLLIRMTEKCFRKCIYKPGTVIDGSERKCIAMCMDRYLDSWRLVSVAYNNRLLQESGMQSVHSDQ